MANENENQFEISPRMRKLLDSKAGEGSADAKKLLGKTVVLGEKKENLGDIGEIVRSLDNPRMREEEVKILAGIDGQENDKTVKVEEVRVDVPTNEIEDIGVVEPEPVVTIEIKPEMVQLDRFLAMPRGPQRDILLNQWLGTHGGNASEDQFQRAVAALGGGETRHSEEPNRTRDNETKEAVESDFTLEEERLVIQNCLDQVFIFGRSNSYEITKALLGKEGFIATRLRNGKETPLSRSLMEKIDRLGLDNWIGMKNTVGHWISLRDVEEVKTGTLSTALFMDPKTEYFFANNKCMLPYEDENGNPTLKEVDLGSEISLAMKKIREHFESGVNAEGKPILVEYWRLIPDLDAKGDLYKELGLNKYIGETAFALLLSYQMLTDTSAEDFFIMMVNQAKGRTRKYKINEGRDPYVRMMIQEDMARGEVPFTALKGDEFLVKRKETEDRIAMLIPAQLIPTGLSGDGEAHLRTGDWLRWRVNTDLFSRNSLDTAKVRKEMDKLRPATDQGTRLDMMRSALTALTLMKEIQDPAADITKLNSIVGKLYSHMTGSFGDAYWLGPNMTVPADFSFKDERGNLHDMPLGEWVSRTMMGVDEAFMYTHSVVDHMNPKPWDMWQFSTNAEQIFRNEVQSGKASLVGMDKTKFREHRREMLGFIDRLWNYSWDLIDKINGKARPDKYPKWYQQGVSPQEGVIEAAAKSKGSLGLWTRKKQSLRL